MNAPLHALHVAEIPLLVAGLSAAAGTKYNEGSRACTRAVYPLQYTYQF